MAQASASAASSSGIQTSGDLSVSTGGSSWLLIGAVLIALFFILKKKEILK